MESIDRRELLQVVVVVVGAELIGCGSPVEPGGTGGGSGIQSNHTHSITIPLADITVGAMKDYHNGISGLHTHSLILTAAEFTTLRSGGIVMKNSNNEAGDNMLHNHVVRLTCV